MVFEELYPNRFIAAADFKGRDHTLTIAAARIEEMVGMKGTEWKAVITFVGKKKEWVVNRTNGECLKLMFGRVVDNWIGKRVTLFPTEVEVAGSLEPAIRVRGSPDITAPMKGESKRGKKTLKFSVIPTPVAGARGVAASASPAPKPATVPPPAPAPAPAQPASHSISDPNAEPPPDVVLPGQTAPAPEADPLDDDFGPGADG